LSIIEKAVARLAERPAPVPARAPAAPLPVRESHLELASANVAEAPPVMREAAPAAPALREAAIGVVAPEPPAAPQPAAAPAAPEPPDPGGTVRYEEIDLARLRDLGVITPGGDRMPIFEEFRLIKRPLIKNALNQGPTPIRRGNLIMVTSCLPGEGKSFCALNLAMSMAMEMDHTVLLVDADVAKPSVPRMLNIQPGIGLMDVLLEDSLPLSQVLIRTNVEKLKLLTSGRTHPSATELLASAAMRDLLEEMSLRYSDRIIVFDSPPLLATTEARVLAGQMGQVVLVVEAGRTTQQTLRDGLHYIESCEVVSLLLNKTKFKSGTGYYGYGYYGGYGA